MSKVPKKGVITFNEDIGIVLNRQSCDLQGPLTRLGSADPERSEFDQGQKKSNFSEKKVRAGRRHGPPLFFLYG